MLRRLIAANELLAAVVWVAEIALGTGEPPAAEFQISGTYEVFAQISRAELGAQKALMTGKLRLKGNMIKALKLAAIADRLDTAWLQRVVGVFALVVALQMLMAYSWPGNIRELKNVIERMIVMSPGSEIGMESLPDSIYAKRHLPAKGARLKDAVEETERYLIEEAYRELGSWKKVAEALGVDRTTIFRKATKYHIMEQ